MSNTLFKLKRSAIKGKTPTTSNLELGELAINTNDGRLFFKTTDSASTSSIQTLREISGGTGITETNGVIAITDTGVTADTVGSSTRIPIITVNAQGQITALDSAAVAGVSSFLFDSATATLTISTADGGTFNARIGLSAFNTDDLNEGATNKYYATILFDSDFAEKTTSDLAEGSNLYYTTERADSDFDARLAVKTTDNLAEGSINLYYDSDRTIATARHALSATGSITYNATTGIIGYSEQSYGGFDSDFAQKTTSDLIEGTNLYFTTARSRSSLSAVDNGGDGSFSYDSVTGAFSYIGPSAAEVRSHFSAGTGINITSGQISSTITQYTDADARATVSVTDTGGDGSLSYDSSTGILTYTGPSASEVRSHFSAGTGITLTSGVIATTITQYTDTLARQAISVTDNGGDGSLSYDNGTGVITYTGPSASEVRTHLSAGAGISYNSLTGVISHDSTTSSQSSVTNTNGTVIQSIDLDTYGHITSINSLNLDDRYYTETEADNRFVNLSGDTMTGFLTLHADPTQALHATTKEYVDNLASGVKTAPACRVFVDSNLNAIYDNGDSGVGGYLISPTSGAFPTIDGISSWVRFDGVLVAAQTNAAENGRYYLDSAGGATKPWKLIRCPFCDESNEIPGSYIFITDGDTYEGTGWIQIVEDPSTFAVGVDDIVVTQFSGAGTYTTGFGLTLTGTQFSLDSDLAVNVASANTADKLDSASRISLTGDISGSVTFDGSQNVSITTSIVAGSIVNADINASAAIVDTKLDTISTAGKVSNSATTATDANTASAIVARDGSGNFTAGTITANLIGDVTGTVSSLSNHTSTIRGLFGVDNSGLGYDSVTGQFSLLNPGVDSASTLALFSTTNTGTGFGSIGYNSTTGVFNYNRVTAANIRSVLSVSGDLAFDSSTGQFSFNETYSTASDLLTAVKTVDGSGSGLDADVLDGQQGSHYRINVYNSSGTLLN